MSIDKEKEDRMAKILLDAQEKILDVYMKECLDIIHEDMKKYGTIFDDFKNKDSTVTLSININRLTAYQEELTTRDRDTLMNSVIGWLHTSNMFYNYLQEANKNIKTLEQFVKANPSEEFKKHEH
jgi:hypothetical protein